jgi:ATP-dependent Clp protease ATP-binding subunit ClpA
VGFEKGGLLSEAIKKHPSSVLLLDEIEKAHPDLLTLLLQIMDSATLTDNNGDKIDFQNVIIIMTSNLGASEASVVGFAKDDNLNENRAINNFFAPEFRNRLDNIVHFNALSQKIILKIVDKFIDKLNSNIASKNLTIKLTQKAKKELASKGYDKLMGARPLSRTIDKFIKPLLTDKLLFGKLAKDSIAKIDYVKDKFEVEFIKPL